MTQTSCLGFGISVIYVLFGAWDLVLRIYSGFISLGFIERQISF